MPRILQQTGGGVQAKEHLSVDAHRSRSGHAEARADAVHLLLAVDVERDGVRAVAQRRGKDLPLRHAAEVHLHHAFNLRQANEHAQRHGAGGQQLDADDADQTDILHILVRATRQGRQRDALLGLLHPDRLAVLEAQEAAGYKHQEGEGLDGICRLVQHVRPRMSRRLHARGVCQGLRHRAAGSHSIAERRPNNSTPARGVDGLLSRRAKAAPPTLPLFTQLPRANRDMAGPDPCEYRALSRRYLPAVRGRAERA
eukprot:scaffold1910_cov251-Pinguiococcus_pyrenoidosus.AAC.3